jgi:predicted DNA-binding transcriptional regulator YafY
MKTFMIKDSITYIQSIDRLARIKGTGTPRQLSERLGVSERTLFRLIVLMRELGAPISYCKFRQTYYYEEEGKLEIAFRVPSEKN